VLAGEEHVGIETRRQRKDGSLIEVRLSIAPTRDASGEVTGMVFQLEDVSDLRRAENERRQLEAQIQHTQKLESLGVLAGGIAHDFNNLLTGMLGNAGLALLDLPDGTARERVLQVETAIQRAAELTHQLLAYAGKASFDVVTLDLAVLVREMTNLLEVSIPKKVHLRLDVQTGIPAIEADPTQIRQIVMNLITNAAEAIGDGEGVIAVRVGVEEVDRAELAESRADPGLKPGPYVCLEVEDTGSGMDAATLERIFDPFYTTKFAGRGLGLAAVLGIARAHRGAISVESQTGGGTRFRILLPPSARHPPAAVSKHATELGESVTGTILVVDDEDAVRAVSKTILDRFGYRTLTARNGKEAVELFREQRNGIDLVLLDMTMPVMDGVEALRELRAVRPDVRVLLSSGHPESEAEDRLSGERLSGFIQKPYRSAELIERVKAALANRP
jgi:two-component system cell cycle sensor histidine kinase/response regulator CckA